MPSFSQTQLNYSVRNANAVVVMIGEQELGFGQTTTLSDSLGAEQLYGIGKIKKAITSTLNALKYTGPGSSGILSSWQNSSLVLTYDGATQTVAITVSVVFVGQNRHITEFVNVQPLNASV